MFSSFFKLLTRCYRLALPYGRLKLFGVMGMILLNGLLQLVGVTSIFPFFALAADPDRIRKSAFGNWILQFLPPMDTNHLLVVAGTFSIVMLFLSSAASLATEVYRIRYAYGFCHWLRKRLLTCYANQPYSYFLRRNSSELALKLWDISGFISSVLLPLGEILSRVVLVIFLMGAVFIVQPLIAFGAISLFGGIYMIIFLWIRPRTKLVSDGLHKNHIQFGKNAAQFLHGIKTIFIHDKSSYFINITLYNSERLGYYSSKTPIYGSGPRYMIEPLAFGGLVAIVVVMALQGKPFSDILPNLSVMAMAGYRLLPSLQMLYSQLIGVASHSYKIKQLEDEITSVEEESEPQVHVQKVGNVALEFLKEITISRVCFAYLGSKTPIINDLTLSIGKNESLGIAGASGSGKSTLVDILLGLHTPTSGRILIDGDPLSPTKMSSWRSMIGYVPQDIYLIDDSIEANIAFGIEPAKVDHDALRTAAQGAQILDFIEKELPEGFQTVVGERGVRLSGGQRQRIGLARALYHQPQILILDEATSALDHQTEAAVMETIHKLQGKLTIITIAHRLSTLEKCDRIIKLDKN